MAGMMDLCTGMRRSERCKVATIQGENNKELFNALSTGQDKEGFVAQKVDDIIGRGVFATKNFNTGDFLLEYKGVLISLKEGCEREKKMTGDQGSFLFFFRDKISGKKMCMDATEEDPFEVNLARLVNDCHTDPNCVMKVVLYKGAPHLCLFACKAIKKDDELRYDYGVPDLPWRSKSKQKKCTSEINLDELTFCGLNKEGFPMREKVKDTKVLETKTSNEQCEDLNAAENSCDSTSCVFPIYMEPKRSRLVEELRTYELPTKDESETEKCRENDYVSDSENVTDISDGDDNDGEYSAHESDESDSESNNEQDCRTVDSTSHKTTKFAVTEPPDALRENVVSSTSDLKAAACVRNTSNVEGRRIWDKRNACYYCKELVTNISRHLQRKHSDEMEVAKASSYSKKSEVRLKHFERLRHLGNFYHNAKVLSAGEGEFLVAKRPPKGTLASVTDYAPCMYCKGFYSTTEVWRHAKVCKLKTEDLFLEVLPTQTLRASRVLQASMTDDKDLNLHRGILFGTMKQDEISLICKTDTIISELGLSLLLAKGEVHLTYIRTKMREMARLLLTFRSLSPQYAESSLHNVIKAEMFDAVIEAIRKVCGLVCEKDGLNPKYEVPSLALKLGHSLRKCSSIKLGVSLRQMDKKSEEECTAFLRLMDLEFTIKVSTVALATLDKWKQAKPKTLPLTQDIAKFQTFIKDKVLCLSQEVDSAGAEGFTSLFLALGKATICRLITFNKRRSGEVGKMLISNFTERATLKASNEDLFQMLTPAEQRLSSRLEMLNITGKRGRTVPVILTKDMFTALELLVNEDNRKKAGIAPTNKYLFPLSRGSLKYIRGSDAFAELVNEADLDNAKVFRSTALRKYIATVSQVLNMEDRELDWLASHLGHDIRVHRQYYRLQEQHIELAKVAKLLYAVDKGKAHDYAGKKLDDIDLEGIEDIEDTTEADDKSDLEEPDDTHDSSPEPMETLDSVRIAPMQKQSEKKKRNAGKKCIHKPWSAAEKLLVTTEFHTAIEKGVIAGIGKKQCEELKSKSGDVLSSRTWIQIKSCVKNLADKRKKEHIRSQLRSKNLK